MSTIPYTGLLVKYNVQTDKITVNLYDYVLNLNTFSPFVIV